MRSVHSRKTRKVITLNHLNQPIGPTKEDVRDFGSFFGTLARTATLCPLDILDWSKMDTKDDLWTYAKRSSEINKENRKKSTDPHTAVIRNELEKTKESISLKEMFVATRARKPGHLYKDSDENTTSKIAEMEKIETQQSVDGSQSVDAFSYVMGPEHPGRLRLYGRGVTKTNLKGKVCHFEPTLNATNDMVQEMQERIRKIEEQMEEQRRTMRQEITADVIAQLQRAGLINPNILETLSVSSLGEATSAPQAANQLIRRPSEGSNNLKLFLS